MGSQVPGLRKTEGRTLAISSDTVVTVSGQFLWGRKKSSDNDLLLEMPVNII